MAKIPKNLPDQSMFKGLKEEETFETMVFAEDEPPAPKKAKQREKEDLNAAYLTKDLQEKLGKALLELKLDLYKEGVVDYDVKLKRDGARIVLYAAEKKKQANK